MKWSEKVEERIKIEKCTYEIEVRDVGEDDIIHSIILTRWHGYEAERFEIEYRDDKLTVIWKYKPVVSNIFETRGELTILTTMNPWWVRREELEEAAVIFGARRTYRKILDDLKERFTKIFEEKILI